MICHHNPKLKLLLVLK